MSNDKWRFDPNKDYRNGYDEDEGYDGNRRGFSRTRKANHHRSDKFDGKRMKRDNHHRSGGKKW